MKFKNKLIIFIASIIFLMNIIVVFSQTTCPAGLSFPNVSGGYFDGSSPGQSTSNLEGHGYVGANYTSNPFTPNVQPVVEIKIDWSSFVNTTDYLSDSTMKKLVELRAVSNAVKASNSWDHTNHGFQHVIAYVYYTKDCKAEVKVHLKVDYTTHIACCSDGMNSEGEIQSRFDGTETQYYTDVSREISCGSKCCRRVYDCTIYYNGLEFECTSSYNSTETISSCDGNANLIDCLTGQPIPCNGNCD